jgi:predicted RNA-binding protein with PIN domain
MHYLIDGHNLISQLSDISLDDPDDEAKLVLLLRSWIAGGRKRTVTVVFDGGLPGGTWRYMSRGKLKALFATESQSADAILINRVQQVKNPLAYTLVTSDREILDVAKKRRMPYMTARAFAQQLQKAEASQDSGEAPNLPAGEKPVLNEGELEEWLAVFNTAEETQDVSGTKPHVSTNNEAEAVQPEPIDSPESAAPQREPTILKSGSRKLSSDEVEEWLALFQDDDQDQAGEEDET